MYFTLSSDSCGVLQIRSATKYFSMYLPKIQKPMMIPAFRSICKPSITFNSILLPVRTYRKGNYSGQNDQIFNFVSYLSYIDTSTW